MDITLPHNWKPRPYQFALWRYLENGGKRGLAVCHRRWGKDDLALHWTAVAAHQRVASYWHMLPEYEQARKAIWTAVNPHTGIRRINEAFPPAIRDATNEQGMFIRFKNGSTWQVVGSDNYNSLVGAPPAGLVVSEWALADPAAWAYLSPILVENGGWALFLYTSRGKNHGHSLYQSAKGRVDWHVERQTVGDTKIFNTHALEEAKADLIALYGEEDGEALFDQEYFCSFDAAVLGSYYGRIIARLDQEKRITSVPYDPNYPVHTGWDLGIDDQAAIWFVQMVGREIRVIDYLETRGRALVDIGRDLLKRPYAYAEHYGPHDMDTREMTTAKTRKQALEEIGVKPIRVGSKLPVADGINAVRNMLSRCIFDEKKCEKGLNALRQYRTDWDDKAKTPRKQPKHDWCVTGDTEILTRNGMRPIKDLPETGEVWTPCGWKVYRNLGLTGFNAPLVAVTFEDGLTVRCTPDHLFLTDSGWRYAASLKKGSLIRSSLTQLPSISMEAFIASGPKKDTSLEAAGSYIELYGRRLSERFRRAATSIIETTTRTIASSATWNACRLENIYRRPGIAGLGPVGLRKPISARLHERVRRRGIDPRRVGFGTVAMLSAQSLGRNGVEKTCPVSIAERLHRCSSEKAGIRNFSAPTTARQLRIATVELLSTREDVFDIEVPGAACFTAANGAVIHNSSHGADAFRELAVQLFDYDELKQRMTQKLTTSEYNPFAVGTPQYRHDLDQMEERIARHRTTGMDYDPFR